MKTIIRLLAVMCCMAILLISVPAIADDGFSTSYTYTYDYWEEIQESPDAYRVETVINSMTLGLDALENIRIKNPQSLFVKDNDIFICDTGNNRIIKIHKEGSQYVVDRIFSEMKAPASLTTSETTVSEELELKNDETTDQEVYQTTGTAGNEKNEANTIGTEDAAAETETVQSSANTADSEPEVAAGTDSSDIPLTFSQPYDVSVDDEGNIYVADYGNQRIVKMNSDGQMIQPLFIKPTDATFDQKLSFLPRKIVVDVAQRVYALCTNVNKGLVKYEADGTFAGFIGANTVSVSMVDYIWKRYFMSKEQRAQSESFVPTEYENIYIDREGFIYATNTEFSEYDLKGDSAKPIRRLNSMGSDILIKNDRYPPIGDLDWVQGAGDDNSRRNKGPSRFTDITVMDNDIYVALDRTRGRLFGYDSQGILLWAFGTSSNIEGAFTSAVSIEHLGYDLLVLDSLNNSITVFTPTEYGQTIFDASESYLDGDYDKSAELWRDVLKMNANYPLAFRGIGRAILRQNRYEEAMDYFELAHDRENYGRAFKLYRKEWIEKNVGWIILIVAALLVVPLVIGKIRKMKWEVNEHERGKVRK